MAIINEILDKTGSELKSFERIIMNKKTMNKIKKLAKESNEINVYLDKVRELVDFDNLHPDSKGEIMFLFASIKRAEVGL